MSKNGNQSNDLDEAEKIHDEHDELVKKAGTVSTELAHSDTNPRVFLDISIGEINCGRVIIEVCNRPSGLGYLASSVGTHTHTHAWLLPLQLIGCQWRVLNQD